MSAPTPPAPPAMRMRGYLQRIATGPELSKPLSREAARDAMEMILERRVSAVQAGIYLIALRMKRETDAENLGSLDALLGLRAHAAVDCEHLLDIAEPFNGYVRGLPATPFLAPLLAACGLNAFTHGLRAVGPKYGITPHLVYAAAGIAVDLPPGEAAARIADARLGWAYLDQSKYFPKLHDLAGLRAQMVKRSCITTLEVLSGPLRARGRTELLTGYVHKAYPPVYISLARAAGYDGALLVRGVEGGCIPALNLPAKLFCYANGGGMREVKIAPAQAGIEQPKRMIAIPPEFCVETSPGTEAGAAGAIAPLDAERAAAECAALGRRA
ncbi:MAG: anthranilate phosphoribosyltransferase, partial [Gammaproteobacteria bacterium]